MPRTAVRTLLAATFAVALLVPAAPAAAAGAPAAGEGWIVTLFDAMTGWLASLSASTPAPREATAADGETYPNLDPNGLSAPQGRSAGDEAETYPNLDPDGFSAGPSQPQGRATSNNNDTLPNLDPDG